MKKSDLKSGMVVKLRDWKEKMILIDDVFCSYEKKDFLKIGNYDEKLNFKSNDRLDIVEVYKCKYPNLLKCFAENNLELIWKREKEIDWSKIPFGTRVRVWDSGEKSYKGKFLGYNQEEEGYYPFNVFVDVDYDVAWEKCELIEEPEEEKEEKEELTLEILHQEYLKYCEAFIVNDDCCDCKYIDNRHGCFSSFILKNYNVTRK